MSARHYVLGFVSIFLAIYGCAAPSPTPLRLYNLDSGDVIHAQMAYSNTLHGHMSAVLPTGETCTGEYTIGPFRGPYPRPAPYYEELEPNGREESDESDDPESDEAERDDWAERYGFTPGTVVYPVGSATLIGDRGTTVEMVFYHYYYYHGPHGDGLARDSHGNTYRVYIGSVPGRS
jgi:hypothetical protein